MTLNETLLAKLADWNPAPGRQTLPVSDEPTGWTLQLTADQSDRLSCLVWEFTLHRGKAAATDLQAWADGVAGRVTGLLEPLRVVEVDRSRREAQLRSDEPMLRSDRPYYYELILQEPATVTLRRYQGSCHPGQRREQVAFALTHEVLAKLVGDLVV